MPRYITLEAKQGGYWLRFDYDPEVVVTLKKLPYWTRKWNPAMKAWWIHPDYIADAKRVVEHRTSLGDHLRWATADYDDDHQFEDVSDYDTFDDFVKGKKREPEPPPPPKKDPEPTCFEKLHMDAGIPLEVAKAFYGTLAKLYHPDTASDPTEKRLRHDRMVQINLAWEQAEKAIKARR
jgi:hypothetical protein